MFVGLILGLLLGWLLAHLHRLGQRPLPPLEQQCCRLFLIKRPAPSHTREALLQEVREAGTRAVRVFKQHYRANPLHSEKVLEEFFSNLLGAAAEHTCNQLARDYLFPEPSRN
jgi:hypothetical protein